MDFQQAHFMLSVVKLSQLPPDEGVEVAFAGRSNAGKSSALNAISGINQLARTSKTPGRTQAINLFDLGSGCRLADLPGYGYAKVPLATKERWQKTLSDYLQTRECLKGLVLVMDIRHPMKIYDEQLLAWASDVALPVHILLTKADKLKHGAIKQTMLAVEQQLKDYNMPISIQPFSSTKKEGVDVARELLTQWFQVGDIKE